jgi:hypothetical protein
MGINVSSATDTIILGKHVLAVIEQYMKLMLRIVV